MENRFEYVKIEAIEGIAPSGRKDYCWMKIYRDKLTGVIYISDGHGLTPLIDKDGKPLTEWNEQ